MTVVSLVHTLADLLAAHHVEAVIKDDLVYLSKLDQWASLWMQETQGGSYLLEVRATAPDGTTIADRWAGIGDTLESARVDGLRSFCSGTFHVLLAALWGVLERDQVDHGARTVENRDWDIYAGPCTLRSSDEGEALVLPQELVELVPQQLERAFANANVHTVRVYLAVVNGAVTVEALVDDEPDAALEEVVRGARWELPATGFASLRWFLAACPVALRPTHWVDRSRCTS